MLDARQDVNSFRVRCLRSTWIAITVAVPLATVIAVPALPAQAACRPMGPVAYAANSLDGTISVINNCGSVTGSITVGHSPHGIAVSPGGATAYSANLTAGTLSVIDSATNQVTATVNVSGAPTAVVVSPDGSRVYVADQGFAVEVVDTGSNQLIGKINLPDAAYDLAISPDGSRLYVADNGSVMVIDTATNQVIRSIPVTAVAGIAVSPDGSTVYAEDFADTVTVIDAATGAITALIPLSRGSVGHSATPNTISVGPDGGTFYLVDSDFNLLDVVSTGTDTVTRSVRVGKTPVSVAVMPAGALAYVANLASDSVSKVDISAGAVLSTIPVGHSPKDVTAVPGGPARRNARWFRGLSCPSPIFCLAVGTRQAPIGAGALAETRIRGRWRLTGPVGLLFSTEDTLDQASCRTASFCVAVGAANVTPISVLPRPARAVPLAGVWNGRRWTSNAPPLPTPTADGALRDVSCASERQCVAVGSYRNHSGTVLPLAELWNGTAWRELGTPSPTRTIGAWLTGVSCLRSDCTAVGIRQASPLRWLPFAESWNGRRWRVMPMPAPGRYESLALQGISCAAPGTCLAVGYKLTSLAQATPFTERLARGRWRVVADAARTPASAMLDSISCPSTTRCVAVGGKVQRARQSPLAETWNGRRWRVVEVPGPVSATLSILSHVSCTSANSCLAVGNDATKTVAESWNGTRWQIVQHG